MTNKLDYISFLKGIAILGVFWVHCPQCFGLSNYFTMWFWPGQFGCQLFFVISGFLAVLSWNRIREEGFGKKIRVFYKKRWVSIFPIYFLAVFFWQIVGLIIDQALGDGAFNLRISHDWESILLNVLLLNAFDPVNNNNVVPGGWFIGTIVIFYLIFPFLNRLYDFLKKKKISWWILVLASVVFSFMFQYGVYCATGTWQYSRRSTYLYFSIINQLSPLLMGMGLYQEQNNNRLQRKIFTGNTPLLISALFMALALMSMYFIRLHYWINVFLPVMVGFSFYYLFVWTKKLFESGAYIVSETFISKIIYLGNISFAIYFSNMLGCFLFSWLVLTVLNSIGVSYNNYMMFVILLPLMWIVTYYIGKQINRVIESFSRWVIL